MNNEQRAEIIKSLAFGMSASEATEVEGVSATEVEQIAYEHADEIVRKKAFAKHKGD